MAATSDPSVRLRPVEPADLPLLFAFQLDPLAAAMAAFPTHDRPAFEAHWHRILADPTVDGRPRRSRSWTSCGRTARFEPADRETRG